MNILIYKFNTQSQNIIRGKLDDINAKYLSMKKNNSVKNKYLASLIASYSQATVSSIKCLHPKLK